VGWMVVRVGGREKENGEETRARREMDDVTEDVERRFAINKEKAKKCSGGMGGGRQRSSTVQ
jgi:hypothetical protein